VAAAADTPDDADAIRRRTPRQRWGLRRRITLTFALGALGLSLFLAFVTYGFARSSVVQQREAAALESARRSAQIVNAALGANATDTQNAQDRLSDQGVQRYVIWFENDFSSGAVGYDENAVGQELIDAVIEDGRPTYMRRRVGDELYVVVGQPLVAADPRLLRVLRHGRGRRRRSARSGSRCCSARHHLALGVLAGTVRGANRAVRPVGVAAHAAKAIAGGRLDTRLEPSDDPDLSVLANSFNDMAAALQTRIERDARFASDVSHELRSPLMTLSASVEVMDARRDEMPERAQAALDLLKSDVVRFQGLVEDLLEISRFDAGPCASTWRTCSPPSSSATPSR
jgi:two-component system sensor histidine kinase MtrB